MAETVSGHDLSTVLAYSEERASIRSPGRLHIGGAAYFVWALPPNVGAIAQRHARDMGLGRCFRSVDFTLDCHSKFISVDEESDDQIVHAFRLGKTDRPPYQPLNSCAQVDMLALDALHVAFRAISTICCLTTGDWPT